LVSVEDKTIIDGRGQRLSNLQRGRVEAISLSGLMTGRIVAACRLSTSRALAASVRSLVTIKSRVSALQEVSFLASD
jgi:hypothetical protein